MAGTMRRRLGAVAIACTIGAVIPDPASGQDTPTGPRTYPTVEAVRAARLGPGALAAPAGSEQLHYGGGRNGIGVTTGSPQVYLVFWGSQWGVETPPGSLHFSNDAAGVAPRLKALFEGIGTNGELWSGVLTQYCEGVPIGTETCPVAAPHVAYPTATVLAGVWLDTGTPVPTTATATQIGAEAIAAAAHFGNTTPASNRNAQYVIVSPTGTHPDGFNGNASWCAWHDYTGSYYVGGSSPYGDLAFTNLPYLPDMGASCGAGFVNGPNGALDGVTMVEGHEYAETLTDQLPARGWLDDDGEENADKCAWISGGSGAARNVAFATGSFAMQATWSNDGNRCAISHPIWGVPGAADDFAIVTSTPSGFAPPGQSVGTDVTAFTTAGNQQTVALTVSGLPADTTASFTFDSISSDATSTLAITTSATTPNGSYDLTITATGSTTHTASYTLVVAPPPTPLSDDVPVTGLSGAAGSDQYFVVTIPSVFDVLAVYTTGGTGDVDVSMRKDDVPTNNVYECNSARIGNEESCAFPTPNLHDWFIRVHGTTAYAGVTIVAEFPRPTVVTPGTPVHYITGAAGSHQFFRFLQPPDRRRLKLTIRGGTGDADLSARRLSPPTPDTWDCQPTYRSERGHRERCTFLQPLNGVWFLKITGYTDFTRLTLSVSR